MTQNWNEFLGDEPFGYYRDECTADMVKSGLTPETLRMAGVKLYHPLSSTELKKVLGINTETANELYEKHRLIEFPYPSGLKRYKILPPLEKGDGSMRKYTQPKDTFAETYMLPKVETVKDKIKQPIWIVEGEKKTLCLIQNGEYCVGIGGVFSFPDLIGWALKSRTVYIGFDADLHENPNVRAALYELGFKLMAKGALAKIVLWDAQKGKGIDDYLVAQNDTIQALKELKESAHGLVEFCNPTHKNEIIRGIALNRFDNENDVINMVCKQVNSKAKDLKAMVVAYRKGKQQEKLNEIRKEGDLKFSKACNLEGCTHIVPRNFEMQYAHVPNESHKIALVRFDEDGNRINNGDYLCDAFGVEKIVEVTGKETQMVLKNKQKELLCCTAISDVAKVDREICSKFLGKSMTRSQIQDVIQYIADYQKENNVTTVKGIDKLGWDSDDYKQFNIPSKFDFRVYWLDQNLKNTYSVKGDIAVQEQLFREIMGTPASIITLSCLASNLMSAMMVQNVTVHTWATEAKIGKTVGNMTSVSVFGNPTKIKKSWNSTAVGKEIVGAENNDMPTLLDDWENAGENKKAAKAVIDLTYGWEDGGGRIRGNKELKQREQLRYAGVLLSSGEKDFDTLVEEIRNERNVTRGAYRRIIQVKATSNWLMPFDSLEGATQQHIKRIVDTAKQNYGYIGMQWIKWAEKNMDKMQDLYNYYKPQITNAGGSEGFFALLYAVLHSEFIAEYLDQASKDRLHQYLGELMVAQEQINEDIRDFVEEFLEYLPIFCMQNAHKIYGLTGYDLERNRQGFCGMVYDGDIFLDSDTFKKICKDKGWIAKGLLEELKKRGKLKTGTSKFSIQRPILGKRIRGYLFLNAIEEGEALVQLWEEKHLGEPQYSNN